MPDPPKPRQKSQAQAQTTPEAYPTAPQPQNYPSGDYSYTVELVGRIENQIGRLTEAVDSLKEQSKDHGKELKDIGKDIHAAKVIGGFLVLSAGFLGWAINQLVAYLSAHPAK